MVKSRERVLRDMGMDYGAAWAFSNTLAEKYGRPLVTGIGVAEKQDGATGEGMGVWYVRVDFHSAESGDAFLLLWEGNEADVQAVRSLHHLYVDLNKQAMRREQERMAEAALTAQAAQATPIVEEPEEPPDASEA